MHYAFTCALCTQLGIELSSCVHYAFICCSMLPFVHSALMIAYCTHFAEMIQDDGAKYNKPLLIFCLRPKIFFFFLFAVLWQYCMH